MYKNMTAITASFMQSALTLYIPLRLLCTKKVSLKLVTIGPDDRGGKARFPSRTFWDSE